MILLPRETVDALDFDQEPQRGDSITLVPQNRGVVRSGSEQQSNGLLSQLAGIGRNVVPKGVRDEVGSLLRDVTDGERFLNKYGNMIIGADSLQRESIGYPSSIALPTRPLGSVFKQPTGFDPQFGIPKVSNYGTRLADAAESTGIPYARTAFKIALAPSTFVSAGIGPGAQAAIRGLPVAARIPLNLLAPASKASNYGTRLGLEAAYGTGVNIAGEEVAKRTDNPLLIGGAYLGSAVAGATALNAATKLIRPPQKGFAQKDESPLTRINALSNARARASQVPTPSAASGVYARPRATAASGVYARPRASQVPPPSAASGVYARPRATAASQVYARPRASGGGQVPPLPRASAASQVPPLPSASQVPTPSAASQVYARPSSNTGDLGEVYGIEVPKGLTSGSARLTNLERAQNVVARIFQQELPNNSVTNRLFEMVQNSQPVIRSVGEAASEQIQNLMREFQLNDKQQITTLSNRVKNWPNGPTMQDLLEHRPKFEPFLTRNQIVNLNKIVKILTPHVDIATTIHPEIVNKAKIGKGGFYSHHSYVPDRYSNTNLGSNKVGGQDSFQKSRKFKTVEKAILAGETPKPFAEAMNEYIQEVGNSAVRNFVANQALALLPTRQTTKLTTAKSRRMWLKTGLVELEKFNFPREYAVPAQRIIARMSRNDKDVALAWQATNNLLRMTSATLDMSFMFVNSLLGLYNDPKAWGTAFKKSVYSLWDEAAVAKHGEAFNLRAAQTGNPTVQQYAARGLHQIGRGISEETGGGVGERIQAFVGAPIPFTNQFVKGGLSPVRASSRAWNTFGDVMRRELADTAYSAATGNRVLNAAEKAAIMSDVSMSANRLTGWTTTRFLGNWGDWIQYAPRFFQATLENIADAAGGSIPARGLLSKVTPVSAEATITQKQARNAIMRMIALGSGMTVAVNEARGKDTDFRPFINGKQNPNFMRIVDLAGRDWSLFGPLDRLLGLALMTVSGEGDRALRLFANSPVLSIFGDILTGKNTTGERIYDEGELPDWMDIGKLGLKAAPFSSQEYVNAIKQTLAGKYSEAAGSVFAGVGGLRQSSTTVTDKLNIIAREKYGIDYYDLKPSQRDDIDKQNPDLIEERSKATIRRGGPSGDYEQIKQRYVAEQERSDASIDNPQDWRKDRRLRQQRLIGAREAIFGPDVKIDLSTPWGQWQNQIKQNTNDGNVDWDAVDEWRLSLDPDVDKQIDDETGFGGTPREREYSQIGRELKKLGYFDIDNRAWKWASDPSRHNRSEYKTRQEYQTAVVKAMRQGLAKRNITSKAEQDIFIERKLEENAVLKTSSLLANSLQEVWIKENVGLTKKAIQVGYLNPSSLRDAEVLALLGMR